MQTTITNALQKNHDSKISVMLLVTFPQSNTIATIADDLDTLTEEIPEPAPAKKKPDRDDLNHLCRGFPESMCKKIQHPTLQIFSGP